MIRNSIIACIIGLQAVVAAALYLSASLAQPDPVPKQPHHVVFVEVCGLLEAVIVTGDPPLVTTRLNPQIDELTKRIRNVPIENVTYLRYAGQRCISLERT